MSQRRNTGKPGYDQAGCICFVHLLPGEDLEAVIFVGDTEVGLLCCNSK